MKAGSLALMIFLGHFLKRLGVFCTEDAKVISKIIIHITIPAALFTSFRSFHFVPSYLSIILIAVMCNASLMFLGLFLSRKMDMASQALYSMNLSSYNIGCFMLPVAQGLLPAEADRGRHWRPAFPRRAQRQLLIALLSKVPLRYSWQE